MLRRIDFSTAAITFALFLTLVTAQVVTIAEGENGPTTLKTIYGAFPLPSTLTQTRTRTLAPPQTLALTLTLAHLPNPTPTPTLSPYPYPTPNLRKRRAPLHQPAARRRRVRTGSAGETLTLT